MANGVNIRDVLRNPNILTLFRIASAPVIILLLLFSNRLVAFLAAVVFSLAAITDYLDGYFARQRGMVSNFGKIMDPLADKLLVSSTGIMLASHGWVPAWIVCVIIAREMAVTGLRNFISQSGGDVSASSLGKYKTGFQIAALIPLLIHYPYFGIDMNAIGQFFLWWALFFTVWSGADYFIRFRHLFRD